MATKISINKAKPIKEDLEDIMDNFEKRIKRNQFIEF